MPLAKYYRGILPIDLNNLIGQFAGYRKCVLFFTHTPKRHFLGRIWIIGLYGFKRIKRRLKRSMWQEVVRANNTYRRIMCRQLQLNFSLRYGMYYFHDSYFTDINKIGKWLTEVLDYSLKL
jgi:hypothetical protein